MNTNNKIHTFGNNNTQLQNITARDITIYSGTESNPELKAEKQKIAEQIAHLVQIVSLRNGNDESNIENKAIDESLFENIDFEDLLRAIEYENCVLFIGPELSVDENGESIHESFYKKISNDKRKYYPQEGLFMPKVENRMINISKDFYKNEFPALNKKAHFTLKKLAQIPFNLIVSLTPDDTMHQVFTDYNIKHSFSYYTGIKNQDIIWEGKIPYIYNALGNARENGRYIYTHKQYSEYLKNDIEAKFPFEIESKIKNEETTHYLFLGFNFNKWYYKLLMYELNLMPEVASYSFDAYKINQLDKEFINKQFKISFIDANYSDFTNILLQKSKTANLNISLDKVFTENILNELEHVRIKTVDEKELVGIKKIENEIQVIKEKINRS